MMMSLSPGDEAPGSPASQLVIMGRFQLDSPDRHDRALRLQTDLFGAAESERSLGITVTRGPETGLIILTPQRSQKALLSSGWQVIGHYFLIGFEHILSGYDHLLFLMVVLLFCGSWQIVVITLTCFTIGHAITLSTSLFAGISVSPVIVEPAIAATIIGMLIFEALQHQRARPARVTVRLGLVFFCALIHGLGLASALQDIGLDTTHRVQSLAGFNLGIEAGQIGVAIVAWTLLFGLRRAGLLPVTAIGSRRKHLSNRP